VTGHPATGQPPAGHPPAGQFATVRTDLDKQFVDVYELAAGAVTKISTVEVHGDLFSEELVWPDAASPIVFRGGVMEGDGVQRFGTIAGGRFTVVKPKGKGDVLGLLTSSAGEVWIERCTKWDDNNPDEEGCNVRGWSRVTPTPGTATKPPPLRVLPSDALATPTRVTLAARRDRKAPNDHVLACTVGGKTVTLLSGDQVRKPPTWRWLSGEPTIALVQIAYAGEYAPDREPHDYRLLRGCKLADDAEAYVLGPDGLWALQIDHPDGGGTEHAYEVRWRGVKLATVDGEAFAFAGGVP